MRSYVTTDTHVGLPLQQLVLLIPEGTPSVFTVRVPLHWTHYKGLVSELIFPFLSFPFSAGAGTQAFVYARQVASF